MGSFEDSIKKTFEEAKIKAPKAVWSQIENGLNADFVHTYQSRQSGYKWIAAAAILLAFVSLAFQFQPRYENEEAVNEVYSGESYNALLSNSSNWIFAQKSDARLSVGTFGNVFEGYSSKKNASSNSAETTSPENIATDILHTKALASLSPKLESAEVNGDIYPYHQGGSYSILSKSNETKDDKLWAGVEAGAGNFSSSMGTSNIFAGSINQSNLATALGSDGFINPSTEIDPNLGNGVATSVGLDLGLRLGERWTFETGIAYTSVDSRGDASINILDIYSVDNSEFFGAAGDTDLPAISSSSSRQRTTEVQDTYDYDVDLESSVRFTSVPLKAGYFLIDRKMSLRLNVGLAANYFMGSQVQGDNNVLNGSFNDSFNIWSFDGLGGVEIGYSIFDRFDLTLEPNYRQSITPLTEANSTTSRFLVQTGLRYKIQ